MLGVKAAVAAVVVVGGDLRAAVEVVSPLVVAEVTGASAVAVEGGDGVVAVAGVGVVLLDLVTYAKGVGVGGRGTPSGYG